MVHHAIFGKLKRAWLRSGSNDPARQHFARQSLPQPRDGTGESQQKRGFVHGMAGANPVGLTDQKGSGRPMDNTLLVSLSQQLAAYRSMDVIANNIANINTPAYKRESVQFAEYVQQAEPSEGETGSQPISFVQDKGSVLDLTQGALSPTGATFDLAINGPGYFTVKTAGGNRYTRDGHFTLDGNGRVVTEQGDALQGDGGDITVTNDDGDVHIAQDGTITGARGQLGQIKLADFANDSALQKEGASLYSTDQTPATVATPQIQQGSLEESNVKPVIEISHMLDVLRNYQTTANLMQTQEDLMRNAIDKLGAAPNSN
jgi:flagellar basal-body rod protein FlgF